MTRRYSRYRGCGRGGGRVYDRRSDPAYLAMMADVAPATSGGRRINNGVSIANVPIRPYGMNPRYLPPVTGGKIISLRGPRLISMWNNNGIGRSSAAISHIYPPAPF